MWIKKAIPNIITILNLLSGSLAIVFIFRGNLAGAALLILAASVLDFLDGFTARILNAYSKIGKELDSLADLVSFGLAPAFIMFKLLEHSAGNAHLIAYLSFLLIAFSALRLAIFNTDEKQSETFSGLPTPANAIFFASFPLILNFTNKESLFYPVFHQIFTSTFILSGLTILFSVLLISKLPLLSLKFKNFSFKINRSRYILIISSIVLFAVLGLFSLPIIIINYIIISALFLKKES
jgi:CDP-diacylglycerol---serine O-phosphatidyltransferase